MTTCQVTLNRSTYLQGIFPAVVTDPVVKCVTGLCYLENTQTCVQGYQHAGNTCSSPFCYHTLLKRNHVYSHISGRPGQEQFPVRFACLRYIPQLY